MRKCPFCHKLWFIMLLASCRCLNYLQNIMSMYVWTRGRLISANGLAQPPLTRSEYAIMSVYCSHTAVTCQSWRQILLMWHSILIRWLTFVLWENGNNEKDEIRGWDKMIACTYNCMYIISSLYVYNFMYDIRRPFKWQYAWPFLLIR